MTPRQWKQRLTIKGPERTPRIRSKVTVETAVERYLSHMKRSRLSKLHIKTTKETLQPLVKHVGRLEIRKLKRYQVGYRLNEFYRRVQPNSYAVYARRVYKFLEYCVRRHWMAVNWVRRVDYRYKRGSIAFFTPIQLDLIFKNLRNGELRDACLLICATGIARSDLDGLVKADLCHQQLVLTDRRVFCPEEILSIAAKRRFFNSYRVMKDFKKLLNSLELGGNFRYLQNSYLLAHQNSPAKFLQIQLGVGRPEVVRNKLKRLTDMSPALFRAATMGEFKNYV